METTEVKSLESAVKQSAEIAAITTETKQQQSPTRADLERSLVSVEHYKLENGCYVKSTGNGYRLEVELEQAPANGDPLWYFYFFKGNVQHCSASGNSYDIAELQKLQDDALKSCIKKPKVAEF